MTGPTFIAVDWGTSNCRATLIEQGEATRRIEGLTGGAHVPEGGFPAEVAKMREALGDLPVLMSGMVGSTVGWKEAPYCNVPTGAAVLADNLLWIDDRTAIIPGLAQRDAKTPDVMRGEEVQIFGAVALLGNDGDGLYCQPGTHSKWVEVTDGQITHFKTCMTGDVFAAVQGHTVLRATTGEKVVAGEDFALGVAASAKGDVLGELFRARSGALLDGWDKARCSAYASGLLIGAECRARVRSGDTVRLVSDGGLAGLYHAALRDMGVQTIEMSTGEAFQAGIIAIARKVFAEQE